MSSQAPSQADPNLIEKLRAARPRLIRRLLQMHFEAKVGHVGGNLSCLDVIHTLFHKMNWKDDAFVLSKGHSAGALYIGLWAVGKITDDELSSFHKNASPVGGHPSPFFKNEIPFFTGSLGHGLGLAVGLALAKKLQGQAGRVYVLLSDGEWQEGSTWEALHFARHHGLQNLEILVDFNGLQGFGRVDEISSMHKLPEQLAAAGLRVSKVAGHDFAAISKALDKPTRVGSEPALVPVTFFETQKGHGISFMENTVDWHYWTLTDEKYEAALAELDRSAPHKSERTDR